MDEPVRRFRRKAPPPYYPQWRGLADLINSAVAEGRLPGAWTAADLQAELDREPCLGALTAASGAAYSRRG